LADALEPDDGVPAFESELLVDFEPTRTIPTTLRIATTAIDPMMTAFGERDDSTAI